jgi:hypothetical protein
MSKFKYPRTLHLPWSLGITSDDKVCKSLEHFQGKEIIVTEKMDGENTTLYKECLHARSLDSNGGIERDWIKTFWASFRHEIPEGWRICGENLWAKHSISYDNLLSYFYGFSVWDENNISLNWEQTLLIFETLGIVSVPLLYEGIFSEKKLRKLPSEINLEKCEGYVIRLKDSFHYDAFQNSVAKFVRPNHVQSDKHWRTQVLFPNTLRLK